MTVDAQPRPRLRQQNSQPGRPEPRSAQVAAPPARLPGRRNPRWIALGVLALCLGGLLSYGIYTRVATETAVVAVAHTVYRGATVQEGDLKATTVSNARQLSTVPADELPRLVGKRATYDLVEGGLVPTGALSDAVIPATGHAAVGVKLGQGRAPDGLLLPGSHVRLVALPPAGSESSAKDTYAGSTYFARVIDQSEGADGTSILLNVDLDADQGPTVALLAAQDRLAVLRDADR